MCIEIARLGLSGGDTVYVSMAGCISARARANAATERQRQRAASAVRRAVPAPPPAGDRTHFDRTGARAYARRHEP